MAPKRNGTSASHEPRRRRWTVYVTLGMLLVFLTTLLFWNGPASLFTDFTGSSSSSKPVAYSKSTVGYRFVLNQTVEDARLKLQYAAGKEIPLCRRYQIITGQWLAVNYSHPPYVPSVQHLRCYPAEHYRQSPYPAYVWMPDLAAIGHCRFDEYDAARMCALLPRATIMIIGDSTSWEQYRSLVSLHGVKTRQGYQFQSLELQQNIQQALCPAVTVVFRRDDYLQQVTAAIQANFPTVLVLNRGSHYVPDTQLVREMKGLIPEVKAWLQQCDDWKIECHFFWRTSVPGHIGCNSTPSGNAYTSPVYDVSDIEQQMIHNRSLYNDITWEYHWQDFQHQNELILKLLRQADLSNFQVLDAYSLNVLRPDEHRAHQGDCLHNCFPGGKVDVTNRLLLHYLRMQRSENDIARLQVVAQQRKWPVTVEDTVYDAEATKRAKEARLRKEAEALAAAAAGRSTESTSKHHEDGSEDKEKDRSSKGNKHASEDGSEDNDDGSKDNEDNGSEDDGSEDDGSEDNEDDGKGGNDDEFGSEDIDDEEEDAENQ